MPEAEVQNRRELKTRARAWPRALARALARMGATPNMVSVASILFAVIGWFAYAWVEDPTVNGTMAFIVAAAAIQLRLLCNLLDGLLAIEGGLKGKTGDLYNEVPDRIADVLFLVGAGYALHDVPFGESLGWACAVLAVLTAYARLLGGSFGFKQDFVGPMAKQHRMFVLTVGTIAVAVEWNRGGHTWSLWVALVVILVGSAITLVRRLYRIARQLESR
jgi:phosphatidylglycerophosphate synthase